MDFSDALKHLKAGKAVRRGAWSIAGVTLVLVPGITLNASGPPLNDGATYQLASIFAQFSNNVGSTWSMPAFDVLAEDWEIIETKEDVFA